MIHKFRKKPVVIEATQFTEESKDECLSFITCNALFLEKERVLLIANFAASIGDWIIKGVDGELYPCKPDKFEKAYEAMYSVDGCDEAALSNESNCYDNKSSE